MAKNCEERCNKDFVLYGNMGYKVSFTDIQYSHFLKLLARPFRFNREYFWRYFCSLGKCDCYFYFRFNLLRYLKNMLHFLLMDCLFIVGKYLIKDDIILFFLLSLRIIM